MGPQTASGISGRKPYEPAVGPRLRILLAVIFAAMAFLGATGLYLLAIRLFELAGKEVQNTFSLGMTLAHVLVGLGIMIPFLIFGFTHMAGALKRPNRLAVRLGILLFLTCIVAGVTGILLVQVEGLPQFSTETVSRAIVY